MASKRTRRVIAISALAVAAAAGPAFAASVASTTAPQNHQAYRGQCLAWFGNKDDGKCLGYSNGQPIGASTPWGNYGPNQTGGVTTGPLLPGQTFTNGVN